MLRVDYREAYGEVRVRDRNGVVGCIKIHPCNALCALIYHYKDESGEKKAQFISFFADEQHIKNCEKNFQSHDCLDLFSGKVVGVKLNLFYKESNILLKHFVRSGHKVTCYYNEPKKK